MKWTLFRKQLVLTAAITLTFVLLGGVASFLVAEAERNSDRNQERNRMRPSPWAYSARILDQLVEREHITRAEALDFLKSANRGDSTFSFAIYEEAVVPAEFREELPAQAYQANRIRRDPWGPPSAEVVRLGGEPATFLVVTRSPTDGPPPMGPRGGPPGMFIVNFVALSISVVLAALVSVFILFRSMKGKARLADEIFNQIKSGNLKARFPIARLDEVGSFMHKFNEMADEIEHLVERLRDTELRRTRLLQELAHDLRTPVASLKTFVETLQLRADTLKPEHRTDLISFSLKEIDYLERLVEDLLFLAQVTEPRYLTNMTELNLVDIADEELNRVAAKARNAGKKIEAKRVYPEGDVLIRGDAHLLRRFFRNACENAFSFAKSEVSISIVNDGANVEVRIEDDGPGLSPEALRAYGEKRFSRVLSDSANGRISVGLGSVIMKAVVVTHHGTLSIQNGQSGARVTAHFHVS